MRRAVVFIIAVIAAPGAFPHEDLQQFIHHTATISANARNVDVNICMTFYGEFARAERDRMDGNGDGTIDGHEFTAYKARTALETAESVQLTLTHSSESPTTPSVSSIAPTIALYDPDINLHDSWSVDTEPLTVTLTYFARTPAALEPGAELQLRDTLWLNVPAICITRCENSSSFRAAPLQEGPVRFDRNKIRVYGIRIMASGREETL